MSKFKVGDIIRESKSLYDWKYEIIAINDVCAEINLISIPGIHYRSNITIYRLEDMFGFADYGFNNDLETILEEKENV